MKASFAAYKGAIEAQTSAMSGEGFAERFWAHDATLWSSDPETEEFIRAFMGWTNIAGQMLPEVPRLEAFADAVRADGFTDFVVCGMGGSSLCALALAQAVGAASAMQAHVLDSTDPGKVLCLADSVDLAKTLFIVASKSGTTVEPKAFEDYFWERCQASLGADAAQHFVAVTDPGSLMEKESLARGYREIFLGVPEIGGRYSVLSPFGLVPAALMGVDLKGLLESAESIGPSAGLAFADNDGFALGAALGALALRGRDKLTFLTSDRLSAFGLWGEQLIAESTGKDGKGVFPLAQEPFGSPGSYSDDRVFAVIHDGTPSAAVAQQLGQALAAAGAPVLYREVPDTASLGKEFLAWELATATIGSVLGLNPFDQPNVQEAKDIAKRKLAEVQAKGAVDLGEPDSQSGQISVYGSPGPFEGCLGRFLAQHHVGDYVALLAFLTETDATTVALQALRARIRDDLKVATSLGYGPRYLHSTGQFHKGGPNTGLFVVLTGGDTVDAEIPGMGVGFRDLKNAQAAGDIDALLGKGRRVLHVDLGPDVANGIRALASTL